MFGKNNISGESIIRRMHEDPAYIPSRREKAAIKTYYKKLNSDLIRERKTQVKKRKKIKTPIDVINTAKSSLSKYTQDLIPYDAAYSDGMLNINKNRYSQSYYVEDINYSDLSIEEQEIVFNKFGAFLNSLSHHYYFSQTIMNEIISLKDQEKMIEIDIVDEFDDRLAQHANEFNRILKQQLRTGNNNMSQKKLFTVSLPAFSSEEARTKFIHLEIELNRYAKSIGTSLKRQTIESRLEILYNLFRDKKGKFSVDFEFMKQQGMSTKDYISPMSSQIEENYIKIQDKFYRGLAVTEFPTNINDSFITGLSKQNFPIIVTVCSNVLEKSHSVTMNKNYITGMKSNKLSAERKAYASNYSPEIVTADLDIDIAEATSFLSEIVDNDRRAFIASTLILISADSKEELEKNTDIIKEYGGANGAVIEALNILQQELFKMVLPVGYKSESIRVNKLFTTSALAVMMPFDSYNMFIEKGIFYGLNQSNLKMIMYNRRLLKNGNGFILGESGIGKSFIGKIEIGMTRLRYPKSSHFVYDPENEYGRYCKEFGAEIVKIGSNSETNYNICDMDKYYGLDEDDDPFTIPYDVLKEKALSKKSEYLITVISKMYKKPVEANHVTFLDDCITVMYQEFLDNDFNPELVPTLVDLQDIMDSKRDAIEDVELKKLIDGVRLYTKGNMNVFSKKTNLNSKSDFMVFATRQLGAQLKDVASFIVLDYIWQRTIENFIKSITTYAHIDEIHQHLKDDQGGTYIEMYWKRGRKFGLNITGITQDVEDALSSSRGRNMISNSDFLIVLSQSATNLALLKPILNLSDTQAAYVQKSEIGTGLLSINKSVIPFLNRFPTDSYLYRLMTTKFGEEGLVSNEVYSLLKKPNSELDQSVESSVIADMSGLSFKVKNS